MTKCSLHISSFLYIKIPRQKAGAARVPNFALVLLLCLKYSMVARQLPTCKSGLLILHVLRVWLKLLAALFSHPQAHHLIITAGDGPKANLTLPFEHCRVVVKAVKGTTGEAGRKAGGIAVEQAAKRGTPAGFLWGPKLCFRQAAAQAAMVVEAAVEIETIAEIEGIQLTTLSP